MILRLAGILVFLAVPALLTADELVVIDRDEMTRALREVDAEADVRVKLNPSSIRSLALLDSFGLLSPIFPESSQKGVFLFRDVPPGKWQVSVEPRDIQIVWVRIETP